MVPLVLEGARSTRRQVCSQNFRMTKQDDSLQYAVGAWPDISCHAPREQPQNKPYSAVSADGGAAAG